MLKGRSTLAAALALVLSAAVLGACGDESSNELRSSDAASLRATLDEMEQRIDNQDCTGAGQQAAVLIDQVDSLSGDVSSKLQRALAASADRLETLVANQCTSAPVAPTEEPSVGATSQDPAQPPGEAGDQPAQPKKDKKPKKEKPNQDQTQTEPGTGGTGQEVPGVGTEGDGGASPGQ